ncbi:hypothetical protein [Echinicola sp. 20G]|uniref:hypothetical protein n=1 Tax=Echinicola sp. 20G TaxID=2781961 RepID=UPI00191090F0|nr:hypothetical protein [Echinicola sp. 20G]
MIGIINVKMGQWFSDWEGQLSPKMRQLFWVLILGIWSAILLWQVRTHCEAGALSIEMPAAPEEIYPYADSLYNELKNNKHEKIQH